MEEKCKTKMYLSKRNRHFEIERGMAKFYLKPTETPPPHHTRKKRSPTSREYHFRARNCLSL